MGLKIEPYMNPIIDSYYKNNAKKLHKMVDKILQKLSKSWPLKCGLKWKKWI